MLGVLVCFGVVLGGGGVIEGDRDLRFCCCAAGIRYILRGEDGGLVDVEDINVQRLAEYVKSCQVSLYPIFPANIALY